MKTGGLMSGVTARSRDWLSRRVGIKRAASVAANGAHQMARRVGVFDRYPLRVARYELHPAGWPTGATVRVAALADLHLGGSYFDQPHLNHVVEVTNALNPDLVVLLGDYGASHLHGNAHRTAMGRLATSLTQLTAPLGTIAVLGNHDWWDDPEAQATGRTPIIAAQELGAAGITVLEKEAVSIDHAGFRFWVAGLGDQWARLGSPITGVDDLPHLNQQLHDEAPAILLAHEPDIFPVVPARYAITLSGHTHAGQIKIFGRTPVVPSKYGSRYTHGHIVEDGRDLIVSAGLGVSILPLRLGTRPEIVDLTLAG